MGFLKGLKDMKDMTAAAPAMMAQAQQLQAQAAATYGTPAQMMASPQMAEAAAHQQKLASSTVTEAALASINGVSLDLFAEICRGIAAYNYDQSKLPELAAARGIAGADWDAAADGWNQRIKDNPKLAQEFNRLYTGR